MNAQTQIVIPGRLEKLSGVRAEVSGFISGLFDDITANRIILSVDEALSNIIRHGYGGSEGTIRLELEKTADALSITITDDAPLFNPLDIDQPHGEDLMNRNVSGGLGIDFYRRMMTAVYEQTTSGGNRLIFSREIPHEKK